MLGNFSMIFNNKRDKDLGLLAVKRPNFPCLKKKYSEYTVQGKSGTLYEFIGYEDRVLEVEYNFIDRINIYNKIRTIRRWLDNIENNKLTFLDDPLYFYKVKKIDYENIERELKTIGRFKVTFILDCFSYQFSSQEEIEIKNGEILINDGDFESKPIIKIEGNGEVNLNINEKPIKLNVGQEIIINSELELCYRGSLKDMQNSQMNGDFPILDIGENKISWDKNVKRLSIIPNYRYY